MDVVIVREGKTQGPIARPMPWAPRQGTVGEGVCKHPQSDRSPEPQSQCDGKCLTPVNGQTTEHCDRNRSGDRCGGRVGLRYRSNKALLSPFGSSAEYRSSESAAAPELAVGDWINSEPLKLKDLHGRVVLIEF